jgi:two-component system response regulator AtoC
MMSPASQRILIVDDEPNMLHMLGALLKQEGLEPVCVSSAQEALQILERESFDYVLSDVRMPGMDGIQLVENLRARSIDAIVILMSAYGNVDLAMEAIRKGAYDYIAKPFKTDEVVLTLRKAAERERLRREVIRLKRRLRDAEASGHIVAESLAMKSILATIDQTARFESSVLITGESGTGKELIAREIHRRSGRAEGPFVAINCTALPEGLLESELFGHARGAFTGAVADKPGLFEEADGGSLLLDEIGAVRPSVQSKLLRVLDTGRIRRVGENQERSVSVRILAATNEDLEVQKRDGLFREDLYYRLSVMHIHIPTLRARREDIVPLVEHFVGQFNEKMRLKVKGISREAQDALLNAPWKGNVRELQNVIERAMILCAGPQITLDCLPHDLRLLGAPPAPLLDQDDNLSVKRASRSLEKTLIIKALNRTGGNRSQAAELLEISYPSLLQKIKDYGLT